MKNQDTQTIKRKKNTISTIIWEKCVVNNRWARKFLKFSLVIIILAEIFSLIADICPMEYWFGWIERLVTYEMANIVPIIAIAWGVVTVLISFLLGRTENRMYGIRFINQLLASYGEKSVFFMIFSFCLQLIFMIISVAYELRILFTAVVIAQILYLAIVFYIVVRSLSLEVIESDIKEQTLDLLKKYQSINAEYERILTKKTNIAETVEFVEKAKINRISRWMAFEMLKNFHFEKKEDVEKVERILIEICCSKSKGIMKTKMVYYLFKQLLENNDFIRVEIIIRDCFFQKRENTDNDFRKGILAAIITERKMITYNYCLSLIEQYLKVKITEEKVELILWTILWAIHQNLFAENIQETIENMLFVSNLKNIVYENALDVQEEIYNKIVWISCVDLSILEEVKESEKIIEGILMNDAWI